MKGWAINLMQEFQGGPKRVRVHTTTDHPTSSYNIPVLGSASKSKAEAMRVAASCMGLTLAEYRKCTVDG